ncbi:hypothetical protein Cgig2_009239 [Carnegiea gigantea]|uniref:Secreted protein n=1 Tax=Carnegiea gigantea TaxID=171969 RepID=A0A9Q1GL71_9CARY|nr:hypothetical protein Cgig2_009239 [Carnegiea gigantea]
MAMSVALLLSLGHFFSSCTASASALEWASSRWHCRSPFSASKASFSFFIFSRRCLYLATNSSDFLHSALRSRIRFSRAEMDRVDHTNFNAGANAWQIILQKKSQSLGFRQVLHQGIFDGGISHQEIHGLGLSVHRGLPDSPLVFLGIAHSRRSQRNVEG